MVYITGCPLLDFFLVLGTLLVSAVKRPSVCEKKLCLFLFKLPSLQFVHVLYGLRLSYRMFGYSSELLVIIK